MWGPGTSVSCPTNYCRSGSAPSAWIRRRRQAARRRPSQGSQSRPDLTTGVVSGAGPSRLLRPTTHSWLRVELRAEATDPRRDTSRQPEARRRGPPRAELTGSPPPVIVGRSRLRELASPSLSRRVERLVGYPPLSALSELQRREFHEAMLSSTFEDLPTLARRRRRERPQLRRWRRSRLRAPPASRGRRLSRRLPLWRRQPSVGRAARRSRTTRSQTPPRRRGPDR